MVQIKGVDQDSTFTPQNLPIENFFSRYLSVHKTSISSSHSKIFEEKKYLLSKRYLNSNDKKMQDLKNFKQKFKTIQIQHLIQTTFDAYNKIKIL